MTVPRNIVVATDLGPGAAEVLDYAVELAGRLDAKLHLVNAVGLQALATGYGVMIPQEVVDGLVAGVRAELDRLVAARAGKASFAPVQIELGEPRQVIVDLAQKLHADLLVVGTHGRTGVRRWVVGSVAESLARTAPCPVLLVRERAP